MKLSHPLFVALFVLFVSLGYFVFQGLENQDSVQDPTEVVGPSRPVYEYLVGGVSAPDMFLKTNQHAVIDDFWQALRFMDRLIVSGRLSEALSLRNRLREMSDYMEQNFQRRGYLAFVAAHADIIVDQKQDVMLDQDLDRANRRLLAFEGLEHFWQRRPSEGIALANSFPMILPDNWQTIEVAYSLRLRKEILSRDQSRISADDMRSTKKILAWAKDHPSALVQAEYALLLEEMLVSNMFDSDKLDQWALNILKYISSGLKGQAPQRNQLLSLTFRIADWIPQSSKEVLSQCCQYVRLLKDQVDGKLFRQAWQLFDRLESDKKLAQLWLDEIFSLGSDHQLYGVALGLKALNMIDRGDEPKEIFAVYDQALAILEGKLEQADLLVDLGVYERELSKGIEDRKRDYLKHAVVRFKKAIEIDPNHTAARINLATISLRSGNVKFSRQWLSEGDFRRATRKQAAVAHWLWAQIHFQEGDADQARAELQLAKTLNATIKGLNLLESQLEVNE